MPQWLASQAHNLSRWLDRRATLLEAQGNPPLATPISADPIAAPPASGPAAAPQAAPPDAAPQAVPRPARGPVPSYPVAAVSMPAATIWRASVSASTFPSQAPLAASVGAPFQPVLDTAAPHVFQRWPTHEGQAVSTTVNEYP